MASNYLHLLVYLHCKLFVVTWNTNSYFRPVIKADAILPPETLLKKSKALDKNSKDLAESKQKRRAVCIKCFIAHIQRMVTIINPTKIF